MIAKDLIRIAVTAVVGMGVGILLLVEGLNRSGGRGTVYAALGVAIIGCVVLFAAVVLRFWWRQRAFTDEERAQARAARLEESQGRRPAWLDSRGFAVLMLLSSLYWTYLLVRAVGEGAFGIAAADGVLLLASASAGLRAVRDGGQKAD
jgi:heme exporter protein D